MPRPLLFGDTETTGLIPGQHVAWEWAGIRREVDGTESRMEFQIAPTKMELINADPDALDIGKYHQRMRVPEHEQAINTLTDEPMELAQVQGLIRKMVDGAVMVGSNSPFDCGMTRVLLRGAQPWFHRPLDVVTLGTGVLLARGQVSPLDAADLRSYDVGRMFGVEPSKDNHTAMGDAEWHRDFYDAVMAAASEGR